MEGAQDYGTLEEQKDLKQALRSNYPSVQVLALRRIQTEIESITAQSENYAETLALLPHILATYPRYLQSKARKAVQQTIRAYIRHTGETGKTCIAVAQYLQQESQKQAVAPTNALILLEWCAVVQNELTKRDDLLEAALIPTLLAAALSFDKCQAAEVRSGIRQAALASVRRGLRNVASHQQFGKKAIDLAVQHLTTGTLPLPAYAGYISEVTTVSTRYEETKAQVQSQKNRILEFYIKAILGSKSALPVQQSNGLNEFVSQYVDQEDLESVIVPAIEKAILRTPEGIVQGPIVALALSLSPVIDVALPVLNKLVKPLMSAMGSTNITTRDGAAQSLGALLARKQDPALILKVVTEILSNMKSNKSQEARSLLAECLNTILEEGVVSKAIVHGLLSIATKEANESALRKEVGALGKHLSTLLASSAIDKSIGEIILKSCAEKRPVFKKIWLLGVGTALLDLKGMPDSTTSQSFVQSATVVVQSIYSELSPSPLPAVQAGTIAAAYVLPALLRSPVFTAVEEQLKTDCKSGNLEHILMDDSSYLLNPKVYGRLTNAEDQRWALRALLGSSSGLKNANTSAQTAWARAAIYLLLDHEVNSTVRKEAKSKLSLLYLQEPASIGQSIILGIWDILRETENTQKFQKSDEEHRKLPIEVAISCISPPTRVWSKHSLKVPQEVLEDQAVSTVVMLSPELIPGSDWINNCLLIGVDPGKLTNQRHSIMFAEILKHFRSSSEMSQLTIVEKAACRAAAALVFVAPESFAPILINQFANDLDAKQLKGIGVTEAMIARAPEGDLVIDPLAKANGVVEDKNRKDYAILKWEEETRSQIAKKKGASQKKLTPDQQAKVDAQIEHEKAVRDNVRGISARLRRGAGFVNALAVGPPTDARLWMSPAVERLGSVLQANAALVVDEELTTTYLSCANKVSDQIGPLRPFVGIATLRSFGNVPLQEELEIEPLEDLATRVLYRLRFAAEQRPFDTPSLAYSLPLIFSALDHGVIGKPALTDDADAQVLLALEFLSFQMSSCTDDLLPRVAILHRLISSMQRYPQHYRLARDALVEFCSATTENISADERDVLLKATTLPEISARSATLQAIQSELELDGMDHSVHIWIACQDEDDENADTALAIWEENAFQVTEAMIDEIPPFLFDRARSTRSSAAKALAQALILVPTKTKAMRVHLQTTYQQEAQPLIPKRDKFGIVQRGELIDHWESRSGLALAFAEMAAVFDKAEIVPFMEFMVSDGPLSDRYSVVREEMVAAGTRLVTLRGKETLESLMQLFEEVLQEPDKATQESDWVNEAVIVLYGSLAQHLPSGDSRLKGVLAKLIETLSTPSESVQFAVSSCLPPLVRSAGKDADSYISILMDQLFQAKKYAARRGAAYGLAGVVKGKGLGALRAFRIMSTLRTATENKKSPEHREGALFAYELFSLILGRTFEPYVVEVLPQLLGSFGDPVASVREACLDTAKTCFAGLSSYGVHQVLPRLLEGLDETQWRSKKGACDLLGAMAYLDPQQLATSLPEIIPPLTAVLTDTHKEVRAAANSSLKRFGEVISNPEVKSLVDILLKALSDPTKYTDEALDSLIRVSFIHYLDAPSLALVVRILERGLHDRSSTKKKAAQIIGSLAHLTEKRDIITHLPILVTGLRLASVDPVPATRATASKALGSLVEKLGEDAFPDLIPSLMSSLRTDTGAGDRLGSAQALSEVLAGLGTGRLEETLPTILQNVQSARAAVREGFMTLFIFLPACFGNSFANYLSQIIPSILGGLADDIEAIRDIALRAGRLLVKNFATRSIDLLLPELQRGLADDNYRIRLSSVELVGDLLFSLTGISAKTEADEEDETAAQAGQSLLEVLGEERRNKVLSSIYICRCDTSGLVRAAAINVWKALVASPRTLREIVPTLTQMIIERLGSSNMEHKVIAGNALGEVIRKAGDNIFASLLPSLEEGLQTATNPDNRQGICIALREVVNAASPDALIDHEKKLISIVRIALVDSDVDVREAAAESFDALQSMFGKRAVDQVLPHLLNLLRSEEEADNALSALLTLLTEQTRANVILPNLIPTLLTNPITTFNARALASLAKVGGSSMNRRLPLVLNTLADNIVSCKDEERREELDTSFDTVLCSVDEYDGLNTAMSVMLALIKHDDHRKRAIGAHHLGQFFATTDVDYSRYNQDLIRVLLISFDDRDSDVVKAAWSALSQLTSHLRKEEMESLTMSTSQVLKQVGTVGHNLPGFGLPKGIQPVLQILLQGLMNGTADQRLNAAGGISDIIDKTSPDSLKAFVTQITGPLIRVVGERSVDVKCAIISALNQLLEKIPTFLRPFLPQLQRTFTKCIADPTSETLRARATKALSTLITLTPRIDPLIAELVTGAKTPDPTIRNSMLNALQEVVSKVGGNMSEASRDAILGLMDAQTTDDDMMKVTMARLLGAMVKVLPPTIAAGLIKGRVLVEPSTPASVLALNAVLAESAKTLTAEYADNVRSVIVSGIDSNTFIQHNTVLAAGKFLLSEGTIADQDANQPIFNTLTPRIKPGNDLDTRRLALVVVRTIARHHNDAIRPQLPLLVEPVFQCLRDPVIPIKLAAEAAWLQMFDVVDSDAEVFNAFIEVEKDNATRPGAMLRVWQDYFKRVAMRLAAQKKEQREAEGGQGSLGLASDEQEDEKEVWSVGKVDLGEAVFE